MLTDPLSNHTDLSPYKFARAYTLNHTI